jgi:hypothetical protein
MRGNGERIDQKNGYRSSLKKSEHPVCQTGQSNFHRENLCSIYFPQLIQGIFRHDKGIDIRYLYCKNKGTNIHKLGLICQNRTVRFCRPDHSVSAGNPRL